VLDEELDPNLVADIQNYVEKLLDSGLRSKLISLIKVTPQFSRPSWVVYQCLVL
jgi:hypothetical protein